MNVELARGPGPGDGIVMAGLEGLEPPTNGLGNHCSIRLSYSPGAWESYAGLRELSTGAIA